MTECRTVGVSIKRDPDQVYEYLADPRSFPQWSLFILGLENDGNEWMAKTPAGTVRIRFTPRNEFRVLDHDVTSAAGLRVHVAMRVIPNEDDGSEVIFTVVRLPGMSTQEFEEDVKMVLTDLAALKRLLEHEA
jgi:hypothetical protein